MRILAVIIAALLLNGCAVNNCQVKPKVDVHMEKDPKSDKETSTTVERIKEVVEPGAILNCGF